MANWGRNALGTKYLYVLLEKEQNLSRRAELVALWKKLFCCELLGLVLLLPLPSMAEDVEHEIIILPAPSRKKHPSPVKKEHRETTEKDVLAFPRYPSVFTGPYKIDLDGGFEFVAPEKHPEIKEERKVSRLLNLYLAELAARDRVHSGHYDQAWIELTQRIEHYWTPSFDQILDPKISEFSGAWLADMTWKTVRGWYKDTQMTRKDPFVRQQRVEGDGTSTAWGNILDLNRDAATDDSFGNRVIALVEIRFGSDGQRSTRLAESSGHTLFDEAAMQGVDKALENKWGDELPEGPVRTIIAMEGHFTILPPLPVVGFTFDEMLGLFDTIYPLKKIVRGKAYLVAVYKDTKKAKP